MSVTSARTNSRFEEGWSGNRTSFLPAPGLPQRTRRPVCSRDTTSTWSHQHANACCYAV